MQIFYKLTGVIALSSLLIPFNNCSLQGGFNSLSLNSNLDLSSVAPDQIFNDNAASAADRFTAAKAVMSRNCTMCHTSGSAQGSLAMATEQEFITSGLVTAGSLSASKLIYRLKNYPVVMDGRTMPPTGTLSAADYNTLAAWIQGMQVTVPIGTTPGQVPNYFSCNQQTEAADSLNAKRRSKKEVFNTLQLVLSRALGETDTTQILSSNVDFFENRVPVDAKAPFSRGDDNFSALHAKAYFDIANELATTLVSTANYSRLVTTYVNYNRGACSLSNVATLSADCRDAFIKNFVLRAWGRPIDATDTNLNNEMAAFQNEFNLAANSTAGINNVVFKALVSPSFLFHLFPDVTAISGTSYRLSSYAIARRLSYNFMQSGLDEGLLSLAQANDLNTDAGFQLAIDYVLSRSDSSVKEFTDEWLKMYAMPVLLETTHPKFQLIAQGITLNDNLRQSMKQEVYDFMNYINQGNRPVKEILTSSVSFARTPDLMKIYGQVTPAPASVNEQNAVRFPRDQRSGILTRAAYMFSGNHTERPIIRGVHTRQQFLCLEVKGTIPANADTSQFPTADNLTTREKVSIGTSSSTCIGCHSQINPVGFAFSQYNALGAYQASEPIFNTSNQLTRYLPTDSSANLLPALNLNIQTKNSTEFSETIPETQDFKRCFSQFYYTYANSLRDKSSDQNSCRMQRMYQVIENGGSLKDFFRASAQDSKYRLRTLVK